MTSEYIINGDIANKICVVLVNIGENRLANKLCSRPHTSSKEPPEKEVLDLLKKKVAWGKEIDRNHLFDYHNIEKMIEEAELRIESLRTKERTP